MKAGVHSHTVVKVVGWKQDSTGYVWFSQAACQPGARRHGRAGFASLNPEEGMRADESEALRLEQELRKTRAPSAASCGGYGLD